MACAGNGCCNQVISNLHLSHRRTRAAQPWHINQKLPCNMKDLHMKPKFLALLSLAFVLALLGAPLLLHAQSSAFTYQGRLDDTNGPVSGTYDLRFKLFTDPLGNVQTGSTLLSNGVPVVNGLFTLTIDFGPGIFNGSNYWLEIDVKTNGGAAYVDLSPLQPITPVPYAQFAQNSPNAGLAAGVYTNAVTLNNASNSFVGSFNGDGGGLSNLTAVTLNGFTASGLWQLGGNNLASGQFLGSTNNQPLELWANATRALRFEPNTNGAPNVIGGSPVNFVDPGIVGATIGGGGAINGNFFLGAGSNHVGAIFGTIGGGRMNTVAADHATIGGGLDNTIQFAAYDGTIAGGYGNTIQSNVFRGVIGGGSANQISGNISYAVIGGGLNNAVREGSSTISGGEANTIQPLADRSVIAGGGNNTINGSASFSVYSTISGGQYNLVQTNGIFSAIGGGQGNTVVSNTAFATISGGSSNSVSGAFAVISGGTNNSASGAGASIGGGYNNSAPLNYTTIGGGYGNIASGADATVPGGAVNTASGIASFAAGSGAQALHSASFVWNDGVNGAFASTAPDQFSVHAVGGVRCVTSGAGMSLDGPMTVGDIQMTAADASYHSLSLSGGNSSGFLYGSYPKYGDGIHLGYNYYANQFGGSRIVNAGGGTSRISVGYGSIVLATGGVGVQPSFENIQISTTSVTVNGTFNNNSDRTQKQDFSPIQPSEVLQKVAGLPLSEWSYKSDAATRHIGPMAQDFYAAFAVGTDDKHIAPIDEGGVALAAIQGLNQKIDSREELLERRLKQKDAELNDLRQQLAELRRMVLTIKAGSTTPSQ